MQSQFRHDVLDLLFDAKELNCNDVDWFANALNTISLCTRREPFGFVWWTSWLILYIKKKSVFTHMWFFKIGLNGSILRKSYYF